MNRETIVRNLLDDLKMWTRKLEEFDREAEKAEEVYVWLLREGKPEKVLVHDPCQMKAMFTDCPEIGYRLDVLPEFTCYPQDEGATWFRSEEAALEAQEKAKTEALNSWISLREAKAAIRAGLDRPCGQGWVAFTPEILRQNTLEIAADDLDRLPRYPRPQGKMVPLKAAIEWLVENGYYWSAHAIEERFAKD